MPGRRRRDRRRADAQPGRGRRRRVGRLVGALRPGPTASRRRSARGRWSQIAAARSRWRRHRRLARIDDRSDAALDTPFGSTVRRPRCPPSLRRRWRPIRGPVDAVLDEFLADADDRARPRIDPALAVVAAEIADLVAAGGKRLRPAFVYWGHRASGRRRTSPPSSRLAAAVEMLHTFALLHDDVMDRALTRRGRPAATPRVRRSRTQPSGSTATATGSAPARRSSPATSPSSGPTSSSTAAPLRPRGHGPRPTRVHDAAHRGDGRPVPRPAPRRSDLRRPGARARRVALLKSGRYTVTRPLELGLAVATAARADRDVADGARRYGDAIGLAFQLRDDVLGLFGDPSTHRQEQRRRPARRQAHAARCCGPWPSPPLPSVPFSRRSLGDP